MTTKNNSEENFDTQKYGKYVHYWAQNPLAKMPIRLRTVDFSRPWWVVLRNEWVALLLFTLFITIESTVTNFVPLAISYLFENQNLNLFIIFIILRVGVEIFGIVLNMVVLRFGFILSKSVKHSASQFFLEVDPVYHSLRQTGKIISKISAATSAFELLFSIITGQLLVLFIGLVSSIGLILAIDVKLGSVILAAFLVLVTFNIWWAVVHTKSFKPATIATRDAETIVQIENLQQTSLIRMLFATSEGLRQQIVSIENRAVIYFAQWVSTYVRFNILSIVYVLIISGVSFYLFNQVNLGEITGVTALGIITTFLLGTKDFLRTGRVVAQILDNVTEITDLWDFIRGYGNNTFPVLTSPTISTLPINSNESGVSGLQMIEIRAEDFSFAYGDEVVFDSHSLQIGGSPSVNNPQLYGLIGPSGTGKSTLSSIIGGQLKPDKGTVFINDIDIYSVGDEQRRELIVMQPQSATALRGSVEYNLTFGLPKKEKLEDEYLIGILKGVGLWGLLENKKGLQTLIGEGGVNLSGGQRQRLNFANSFVRWEYFKPKVVLVDEPTSSLDEISERSITKMIRQMGQTSIVIVIAHRLNTLESAIGLMDSSLFVQDKNITPLRREELLQISTYYQNVMEGKEILDSGEK